MKKLLFVFVVLLLFLACDPMEQAQWDKARAAEVAGLPRNVKIYEAGILLEDWSGYFNIEHSETSGFMTVTQKKNGRYYSHKVKSSYQTLIIIKELPAGSMPVTDGL